MGRLPWPERLPRPVERFPDDGAVHDLGLWHQYETAQPDTFVAMYQFGVQKPV